ncbi:hypothetical protein Micbo1qcDRAFT_158417 [Microdochium bolleyi]|uniref:Zn(2)-C6 fungal-type domain-containing protein n=1 Tax=Microdochium bolleyi TaxID=196109 RepID=A0A136JGD1_9PEZI|nr:hypothetical protein Micbo1qcDRAFT_158417 [Microdochium bolleyi]
MPPGRPSKRTGESADGDSSDEHSTKLKSQRTQRGSTQNDFSSVVKSKLQSYTRTGQACDRCKVRKIRCDALPEGCSHCISQNLECYVTDRVTGRTERRGYTQELEREKAAMMAQIRTLERMLESNGIHATRFQWPQPFDSPRRASYRSNQDISSQDASQQTSQLTTPLGPSSPFSTSESTSISAAPGGTTVRPHLVSFDSLKLSVLGNEIDLGAYEETNIRDAAFRATYFPIESSPTERTALHTLLNLQQPASAELPQWNDALQYAEWWFTNVYPFFPVLHQPTFFSNLKLLYENPASSSLTSAELVAIHMVFATTLRQVGLTSVDHSRRPHMHSWSDKHYYYALGKFSELLAARDFRDCQALALVLFHATRFSKPRVSAWVANQTLCLAMELSLHRRQPMDNSRRRLDDEIRKRLWWAVLWLAIIVLGRMGRPMPLGLHDMDVDYPEALPDEVLEEQGSDPAANVACPFLVGLWIMRATRMYLHMYSTIYSIRPKPSAYLVTLRGLEKELRHWEDSLPSSLRIDEAGTLEPNGSDFHALYIQYITLNLRLYLRHPMALPPDDQELLESTLQANEASSKALLKCLLALQKIRSIEATWLGLGTYTTGAFLHLTSYWQRRNVLSEHDILTLRRDMMSWFMIINETSQLLDNGQGLPAAINDIIQRILSWIEQDRRRPSVDSRSTQLSQEGTKPKAHEPTHLSHMSAPTLLTDAESRNTMAYTVPGRTGYYPDPSVTSSAVYGGPMNFSGTPVQTPNAAQYNPANHHFPYGAQLRMEQPQGHEHAPGSSQRNSSAMESYGPGAPAGMAQGSQPVMWRSQLPTNEPHNIDVGIAGPSGSGAHGDSAWNDWNAAIPGGQESRYGPQHTLMSMGQPQRQEARTDGGMPAGPEMEMGIVPGSNDMTWPGMMYHSSSDRQPRPPQ